jgi:hypothetical protein
MTPRTRLAATSLVMVCAGSLVACGTPRVAQDSAPSGPAVVLPTPAVNDFVSTVMRTRGLGAADLSIEVNVTTDEGTVRLIGTGPASLGQGYGGLDWVTEDGDVFTEVSNGKGLFVQADGPTEMWTHSTEKWPTPTSRLADPLRGIGTATDVVKVGSASLGKLDTVRYTGRIPASPESLMLMGLEDEQIAALEDSWRDQWIDIAVWADPRGRIVRIERSVDLPDTPIGPVSATTTTEVDNFSRTIDLDPPPSESVTEAPSSTD